MTRQPAARDPPGRISSGMKFHPVRMHPHGLPSDQTKRWTVANDEINKFMEGISMEDSWNQDAMTPVRMLSRWPAAANSAQALPGWP